MKGPLLQIGITGGIGSGKSLVCRIFRTLGIPVYDADARARSLMTEDPVLIEQIRNEFGALSYKSDGTLNREHISSATFGHPGRLEKLNQLVHPRVATDYSKWVSDQTNCIYVIREAALLYESGSFKSVDKMIVVSAPEDLRFQRTLARDPHRSKDDIIKIMESQWPESEKISRADFVILNDDHHMVIPQVLELHKKFSSTN